MTAPADVVSLCQSLLRFDTTNTGEPHRSRDDTSLERKAAEWVAGVLTEAGAPPQIIEAAPGRTNVIARVEGRNPQAGALLVHAHLDVVPAGPEPWDHDPFGGEIAEGCLWGRGAVDMKDMAAMMLATIRKWHRTGERPRRDILFAFLADEEAGGRWGAEWLVAHRPELFEGVTEAISECGGFSATLPNGKRLYLVDAARKGLSSQRVTARGTSGHGSVPLADNAVVRVAGAVARIAEHSWPVETVDSTHQLLSKLSELGAQADPHGDPRKALEPLGALFPMVAAGLTNTAVPTNFTAGQGIVNVIAGQAEATVDGRYLPGGQEAFHEKLTALAGPDVEMSSIYELPGCESPFDVYLVDQMRSAIRLHDPGADIAPFCLSGGTDNSAFKSLGIEGYGFVPLKLPDTFDFPAMFHGVNERIPLSSLEFGADCLDTFLLSC